MVVGAPPILWRMCWNKNVSAGGTRCDYYSTLWKRLCLRLESQILKVNLDPLSIKQVCMVYVYTHIAISMVKLSTRIFPAHVWRVVNKNFLMGSIWKNNSFHESMR